MSWMPNTKYSKRYMLSHDIDVFCCINNYPVHIASAGGVLPDLLRDRHRNRHILLYLYDLVKANTDHRFFTPAFTAEYGEDYIFSFQLMAKFGFYSFDRLNFDDSDDFTCRLVAYPTELDRDSRLITKLNFPIVRSESFKLIDRFEPFNSFDMGAILKQEK